MKTFVLRHCRTAATSFVIAAALFTLAQSAAAQSPWRQADFAADLHRRAVAAAEKDANVVVSP